jgi:hypothetical protein
MQEDKGGRVRGGSAVTTLKDQDRQVRRQGEAGEVRGRCSVAERQVGGLRKREGRHQHCCTSGMCSIGNTMQSVATATDCPSQNSAQYLPAMLFIWFGFERVHKDLGIA